MATLDMLIPTFERKTGLAVVLTSLLGQTFTDFDVIVSDQSRAGNSSLDGIEQECNVAPSHQHWQHDLTPDLAER